MSNQDRFKSSPFAPGVSGPLWQWLQHRHSGVLFHPTALPSQQGVGVLQPRVAGELFDYLAAAGIRYWQVCPLGPTGYGDSPYQCFSAFAANPYLIDVEALEAAGLIQHEDWTELRRLPEDKVDFGWLYVTKWPVLKRAYEVARHRRYRDLPYGDLSEFERKQASWLKPYALFVALKEYHGGKPWWEWPTQHRFLAKAVKAKLPTSVQARAEAEVFYQYLVFGQWREIRAAAAERGLSIIGDAPIFVARDSADVWARPDLFLIDRESGAPVVVAGVPPDYFSADGQLWGNPLYDWPAHAAEGYTWWIERLRANFAMCDVVRIDHFRAFDTYWAIPAAAATAREGEWRQGPGLDFFRNVRDALPDARLIAEDLGDLFESVRELRDACGLPGMSILQFAFGGESDNLYLPHNLVANSVVYPGTHDNDTSLGWYASASPKARDHVRRYLRVDGREIGWDFIRSAYASVARLAVLPIQDLLSLGSEGRFNTPGVASGNWQWRCTAQQLASLHGNAAYLRELGELHGRS